MVGKTQKESACPFIVNHDTPARDRGAGIGVGHWHHAAIHTRLVKRRRRIKLADRRIVGRTGFVRGNCRPTRRSKSPLDRKRIRQSRAADQGGHGHIVAESADRIDWLLLAG